MKCQKCNEREASFHYMSDINGERTEKHLCAECAREEGFAARLDRSPAQMLGGMHSLVEEMFSDFFSPHPLFSSPFAEFDRAYRGIMSPISTQRPLAEPRAAGEREHDIPLDAGSEVRARRHLAALKAQLDTAVKEENYERAIELRDEIRRLEA